MCQKRRCGNAVCWSLGPNVRVQDTTRVMNDATGGMLLQGGRVLEPAGNPDLSRCFALVRSFEAGTTRYRTERGTPECVVAP